LIAGFRAFLADPALRMLVAGQILLSNFFYVLYDITSTVFSVLASRADPERAALVASSLTGAYGLGALAGGFAMVGLWRRLESKTRALGGSERAAAQSALLARSASGALAFAALSLLGSWLFLAPAQLASAVWPFFAVTPALVAIGLASQIAFNLLDTLTKAKLPPDQAAGALGAIRALTYFSYAVSFLAWGAVFQWLQAQGFLALAAYCTVVAGAYVLLALRLRRQP
jgi:hypothetical protein